MDDHHTMTGTYGGPRIKTETRVCVCFVFFCVVLFVSRIECVHVCVYLCMYMFYMFVCLPLRAVLSVSCFN